MKPVVQEDVDDLAAEEENKLVNEVRFTRRFSPSKFANTSPATTGI
jgi:hypothetical protein